MVPGWGDCGGPMCVLLCVGCAGRTLVDTSGQGRKAWHTTVRERSVSCDEGQGKPEDGTFPRSALHTDLSLVLSDERLTDI
jgi:hypothetical protein